MGRTTLVTRLESQLLAAYERSPQCHRAAYVQSRRYNSTESSKRRRLHTTQSRENVASASTDEGLSDVIPTSSPTQKAATSTLECLPLSQVLRSFLMMAVSSSPALLGASTSLLQKMLESKSFLFSLERNPVMRALLWETFYKQFCAGENKTQITKTMNELRAQGYAGVILEYALEVLKESETDETEDIETWRHGMLDTINMASEGDFVGLKWSGMGPAAMRRMGENDGPSKPMEEAMHTVCKSAAAKDVSLLPAAEEAWTLDGFFNWCLRMQRSYNTKGKSVVYTTYQAYLKQMPGHLSRHLVEAKRDNFTLGAKIVRGAYLATEKRELIHPTIEATHTAYDGIASALIHRSYNDTVKPINDPNPSSWPDINVVLATHNAVTVQKAQEQRQLQYARGERLTPLAFAQLQGMADEVSCALLKTAKDAEASGDNNIPKEKVFKCTTWGTMNECLNYLLRRAAENKDAASRTVDSRKAMAAEIWRRGKSTLGAAA